MESSRAWWFPWMRMNDDDDRLSDRAKWTSFSALYCIVMNLKMHNFGNEIDNPRTKK